MERRRGGDRTAQGKLVLGPRRASGRRGALMLRWLNRKVENAVLKQQIAMCTRILELGKELRPEIEAAMQRRPDDERLRRYLWQLDAAEFLAINWRLLGHAGTMAPPDEMAGLRRSVDELTAIYKLVQKAKR